MTTLVILSKVYTFPNGMVVSYDQRLKQVSLLQGKDTLDLRNRIKNHSNGYTEFHYS